MWTHDIPSERRFGVTRCCSARVFGRGIPEILAMFGLSSNADGLSEVSPEKARSILEAVLHQDLAYSSEVMPRERAQALATEFVASQPEGVKYFSNGDWTIYFERTKAKVTQFSFTDFTQATFDAGILAVGAGFASCVWVEDED